MKAENFFIYATASSNPYSPELEGGASYVIHSNGKIFRSSTISTSKRSQPRLLLMAIWSALLNCPKNSNVVVITSSHFAIEAISNIISPLNKRLKGKHLDIKQKMRDVVQGLNSVTPEWIECGTNDILERTQECSNSAMKDYRDKHNLPLYTQFNTPIERLRK